MFFEIVYSCGGQSSEVATFPLFNTPFTTTQRSYECDWMQGHTY